MSGYQPAAIPAIDSPVTRAHEAGCVATQTLIGTGDAPLYLLQEDAPKRPADYTTRPQPVIKENGWVTSNKFTKNGETVRAVLKCSHHSERCQLDSPVQLCEADSHSSLCNWFRLETAFQPWVIV